MPERPEVPDEVLGPLRAICLALPDAHEEPAWVGTRWRIRTKTFAHVVPIEHGWPPAYARASGREGPVLVLMVRSTPPELDVLRNAGDPFFAPPWRRDEVGVVLPEHPDWAEITELCTESYCVQAPAKLRALVSSRVRAPLVRTGVVLHEDRGRAESFGNDAERYDRARPGYPVALLDELLGGEPRTGAGPDVLDVGCGTGRVGLLFTAAGASVLGIEPDERMAQVARRRGLTVERGRFEQWDPRGRTFDLVVSGQAWHWVDPVAGAAKAAAVLRPGGRVAVFWNRIVHDEAVARRMTAAYSLHAPALVDSIVLGHMGEDRFRTATTAFAHEPGFGAPQIHRFRWPATYTRESWLDHVFTHSDHAALDPEHRRALGDAIGDAVDESGGELPVTYETVVVAATRTGRD